MEGSVEWRYQKTAAEDVVRNLTGVKGVINLVEVKPAVSKGEVKTAIEAALKRSAQLDASRIKVETDGGSVKAAGIAGRAEIQSGGGAIHVDDVAYEHAGFRPWRLIALAFKALRALRPELKTLVSTGNRSG